MSRAKNTVKARFGSAALLAKMHEMESAPRPILTTTEVQFSLRPAAALVGLRVALASGRSVPPGVVWFYATILEKARVRYQPINPSDYTPQEAVLLAQALRADVEREFKRAQ